MRGSAPRTSWHPFTRACLHKRGGGMERVLGRNKLSMKRQCILYPPRRSSTVFGPLVVASCLPRGAPFSFFFSSFSWVHVFVPHACHCRGAVILSFHQLSRVSLTPRTDADGRTRDRDRRSVCMIRLLRAYELSFHPFSPPPLPSPLPPFAVTRPMHA